MVNIASGGHDRLQNVGALLDDDGVQCMSDFRLAGVLGSLSNVLDGVLGSIAIVNNTVALTGIQELLDVLRTLARHSNNRVDVAALREFDGKCTNSRTGSIYHKGGGILCGCPRERQFQMVVEADHSSQAGQRDCCSFC